MRLQLVILGWEIFSLSLTRPTQPEEFIEGIAGGSSHNFERLPEEWVDYEEHHRVGFH